MTAVMPGGTNQTTAYVYGPSPSGSYTLHDNDLLAKTEYPDPTTGLPSTAGSNDQTWTYNGLGDVVETYHDENGSVHAYVYDVLGRLAKDELPLHGSGVDATVGSEGYTYDTNGQLSTASTYSNTEWIGVNAANGSGSTPDS